MWKCGERHCNIVLSCIRRNWIHWWGPWWTTGRGGEGCSSTVTSRGPVQTLGSTSITCMTSCLCIFPGASEEKVQMERILGIIWNIFWLALLHHPSVRYPNKPLFQKIYSLIQGGFFYWSRPKSSRWLDILKDVDILRCSDVLGCAHILRLMHSSRVPITML